MNNLENHNDVSSNHINLHDNKEVEEVKEKNVQ